MTCGRSGSFHALHLKTEETMKKESSLKQKLICDLLALWRSVSLYRSAFTEMPSSKDLWELTHGVSKLEINFGMIS